MRLHGVWVDTVVEKPTIWRCRCGAMLSTQKAMMRHVAGDTMCQHRGEGMVAYVPESPGPEAGSEGSIPKRQAGLHDDELLFQTILDIVHSDDYSDQPDSSPRVRDILAVVRGAGVEVPDETLASARGFNDKDAAAIENVLHIADVLTRRILRSDGIPDAAWHARCRLEDALITATVARTRLAQTREDTSVSSNPSGAVPLEPQEENREHVETALAELNGLKDADLGRYERECLEAAEGALRRALSAVPLLQDGDE